MRGFNADAAQEEMCIHGLAAAAELREPQVFTYTAGYVVKKKPCDTNRKWFTFKVKVSKDVTFTLK